jgi:glycosyltransferase involved in cell wall biosynthesis
VLGISVHRQARAGAGAGAEVRVLALHRLVPPRAALSARVREPREQFRDGIAVTFVSYVSPPRERAYARSGAWAAPALARALRRLHREFPYELVHALNAVPPGDAWRRARALSRSTRAPLVTSVHGADVLYAAPRARSGSTAVERTLRASRLVLANSHGIAELARARGARATRVVHLGAELPPPEWIPQRDGPPTLVTVARLVARKRHADVMRVLAVLAGRHPTLRYAIVGDGPEKTALEGLAARLSVSERVDFHGQLPPEEAVALARRCTLFVMPSTEEAFGVAYVEAMAGGVPAIGCRGEPGPEEIAAAGDGLVLVPPGDIERLSQRIDELLSEPHRLREARARARATVAAHFTWERCGHETIAAYEQALL